MNQLHPIMQAALAPFTQHLPVAKKNPARRNGFSSHVAGIPCLIDVTYFSPGCAAQISGPPERCYPAEDPVIDFDVLDRNGRPALWLEKKMTATDRERIEQEVCERHAEERDCYEGD